jgi:dienelactone hydrolase
VKIPAAPIGAHSGAADEYSLEAEGNSRAPNPPPPRAPQAPKAPAPRKAARKPKPSAPSKGFFSGAGGAILIFCLIGFRAYNSYMRTQARRPQQGNPPNVQAQLEKLRTPALLPPVAPWNMPALPELTPGVELEPGVILHEIPLPGKPESAQAIPAHSGKLWVYLPAGDHAPQSLACILIAGAGSNLITGMDLGNGDRPEHLPYVKAGYAVVAYELDGKAPEYAVGPVMLPFIRAFVNAQAGLLNARVAIECATTRVAAIDPRRLYAAGHSSAGTVALLLAENEPRLAGCLAYAPAVDLTLQYPANSQRELETLVPGAGELFTRFNPAANEAKINCPLFLYFAEDDARFAGQVRELDKRLKAAGKSCTLESASTGGHYDAMINTGIPRGIDWLKSRSR